MPVQPLKSADPLFKSGSGDHLYPASQKFGDLDNVISSYPDKPSNELMGTNWASDPYKWYPDTDQLILDLADGKRSIHDSDIQERLLMWMSDEQYNEFLNTESGEKIHALVRKRGNKAYAAKKTEQKGKLCRALDGKEFDYPIGGRGNVRMTRLLFITVNFDRERFSPGQAWYAIRSTPVEGCKLDYNVLNNLNANLTKIFGKHHILTCKEAQASGYPAPHIIAILEKPVRVRLHNTNGKKSWRIDDPKILHRIGKSTLFRKLAFNDHRKMMRMHPIWKHGFIDFQGIVKGYKVSGKKDAFTYAFKYLTKCLTEDNYDSVKDLPNIDCVTEPGLRTTLFTHLGNKCFRTRDITFTKKFVEALGGLDDKEKSSTNTHIWKRIRTVSAFIVEKQKEIDGLRALQKYKEAHGIV